MTNKRSETFALLELLSWKGRQNKHGSRQLIPRRWAGRGALEKVRRVDGDPREQKRERDHDDSLSEATEPKQSPRDDAGAQAAPSGADIPHPLVNVLSERTEKVNGFCRLPASCQRAAWAARMLVIRRRRMRMRIISLLRPDAVAALPALPAPQITELCAQLTRTLCGWPRAEPGLRSSSAPRRPLITGGKTGCPPLSLLRAQVGN